MSDVLSEEELIKLQKAIFDPITKRHIEALLDIQKLAQSAQKSSTFKSKSQSCEASALPLS
jgi:hypothetical protein